MAEDTLGLNPDILSILSILIGVNDASSAVFHREPVIDVKIHEENFTALLEETIEKQPGRFKRFLCLFRMFLIRLVQEHLPITGYVAQSGP